MNIYIYIYIYWSLCKIPVILVNCYLTLNVLYRYSQNTPISNFMKIRGLEAELFHAHGRTDGRTDEQTDMMKLIVAI